MNFTLILATLSALVAPSTSNPVEPASLRGSAQSAPPAASDGAPKILFAEPSTSSNPTESTSLRGSPQPSTEGETNQSDLSVDPAPCSMRSSKANKGKKGCTSPPPSALENGSYWVDNLLTRVRFFAVIQKVDCVEVNGPTYSYLSSDCYAFAVNNPNANGQAALLSSPPRPTPNSNDPSEIELIEATPETISSPVFLGGLGLPLVASTMPTELQGSIA